jgi:hypothetical protein
VLHPVVDRSAGPSRGRRCGGCARASGKGVGTGGDRPKCLTFSGSGRRSPQGHIAHQRSLSGVRCDVSGTGTLRSLRGVADGSSSGSRPCGRWPLGGRLRIAAWRPAGRRQSVATACLSACSGGAGEPLHRPPASGRACYPWARRSLTICFRLRSSTLAICGLSETDEAQAAAVPRGSTRGRQVRRSARQVAAAILKAEQSRPKLRVVSDGAGKVDPNTPSHGLGYPRLG